MSATSARVVFEPGPLRREAAGGALRDEGRSRRPAKDGHDTSLFRRLVLGWIEADFRVQIHIFKHLSKSTRKSSSREQISQISAKKLEIFAKFLTFFGNFCKILQNLPTIIEVLRFFAIFWQKFAKFAREKMIFF